MLSYFHHLIIFIFNRIFMDIAVAQDDILMKIISLFVL
ncbi:hypothetical protein L374_01340 [Klebsiella oxytoca MGH 28]|nr:hypothetical protein L374_01340 [Klebsiella oxytoca MGH 28]